MASTFPISSTQQGQQQRADEDYYTFDHDKYMFAGHSGKQRSKKEAAEHTNRFDPNGHTRKVTERLRNSEKHINGLPKGPISSPHEIGAQCVKVPEMPDLPVPKNWSK